MPEGHLQVVHSILPALLSLPVTELPFVRWSCSAYCPEPIRRWYVSSHPLIIIRWVGICIGRSTRALRALSVDGMSYPIVTDRVSIRQFHTYIAAPLMDWTDRKSPVPPEFILCPRLTHSWMLLPARKSYHLQYPLRAHYSPDFPW